MLVDHPRVGDNGQDNNFLHVPGMCLRRLEPIPPHFLSDIGEGTGGAQMIRILLAATTVALCRNFASKAHSADITIRDYSRYITSSLSVGHLSPDERR